jgi:pilus assembly protein CpaB
MFGASALCAGAAVSLVNGYAADVRAQVGPLVPAVVSRDRIPRGRAITPSSARKYLSERRVPRRYVPPGSFRSASQALGLRARTAVPAGSYVGGAQLGTENSGGHAPAHAGRGGARVVEITVAGAGALAGVLRPGERVDVIVTSERGAGEAHSYLALQRVELVDFRPEGGESTVAGERAGGVVAALRVTLRQAVLLTAAQNFARELRLVPRPPGDRRTLPATAVSAADLHP